MNLTGLLNQFSGNAATLMFGTAMHYFQSGAVDFKHLDADAMALSLTAALAEVEKEHPGLAEKYGWCQLSNVGALAQSLENATQATKPSGLT